MRTLLVLLIMLLPLLSFAQQEDAKKQMTKYEEFTSKTGLIIKFSDINLTVMSTSSGNLDTGIRILVGDTNTYFYKIEQKETSNHPGHIALIEYSDLVEINKALLKLSSEIEADIAAKPDYLENKFITEDGFEVGYYISKGKANWFMKLDGGASSTVFVSQGNVLAGFKNAQNKIEEMKTNGN